MTTPITPSATSLRIEAISPPAGASARYYAFLRCTGVRLSATLLGHPMPLPTALTGSDGPDQIEIEAAGIRLRWDPRKPPSLRLALSEVRSEGQVRVIFRIMSTLGRTLDSTVEMRDEAGCLWRRYRPHALGIATVDDGATHLPFPWFLP